MRLARFVSLQNIMAKKYNRHGDMQHLCDVLRFDSMSSYYYIHVSQLRCSICCTHFLVRNGISASYWHWEDSHPFSYFTGFTPCSRLTPRAE